MHVQFASGCFEHVPVFFNPHVEKYPTWNLYILSCVSFTTATSLFSLSSQWHGVLSMASRDNSWKHGSSCYLFLYFLCFHIGYILDISAAYFPRGLYILHLYDIPSRRGRKQGKCDLKTKYDFLTVKYGPLIFSNQTGAERATQVSLPKYLHSICKASGKSF